MDSIRGSEDKGNSLTVIATTDDSFPFGSGESKVCTVCNKDLPLELFAIQKHGAQGRASQCKACKNKKARKATLKPKEFGAGDDIIYQAFENAAYRILKERL